MYLYRCYLKTNKRVYSPTNLPESYLQPDKLMPINLEKGNQNIFKNQYTKQYRDLILSIKSTYILIVFLSISLDFQVKTVKAIQHKATNH